MVPVANTKGWDSGRWRQALLRLSVQQIKCIRARICMSLFLFSVYYYVASYGSYISTAMSAFQQEKGRGKRGMIISGKLTYTSRRVYQNSYKPKSWYLHISCWKSRRIWQQVGLGPNNIFDTCFFQIISSRNSFHSVKQQNIDPFKTHS